MAFVSSFMPALPSQLNQHQIIPAEKCRQQFLCARVQSVRQSNHTDNKSNSDNKKNNNWKKKSSSRQQQSQKDDESKKTINTVRAPRPMRGGGRYLVGDVRTQGKIYARLPSNPPGLRISAGKAKGRLISSPNVYLRPMMAKVREAVFSMLNSMSALDHDRSVLDLFCGSGSVGIEAISRGMSHGVFVDCARQCVETTENNLKHCGFENKQNKVVRKRVNEFLENYENDETFGLITITPPYEEVVYEDLMNKLVNSSCIGEGTFVVVEYPIEMGKMPPVIQHRLIGVRNRRYGRTMIAVYVCQPNVDLDLRPEEFDIATSKRGKRA